MERCYKVNHLNHSLQCEFVKSTSDCEYNGIFIAYLEIAFCYFGEENKIWTTILYCFILMMLFFAMGVVADEFLCPSLMSISKLFKLSQNIAGVTLLAFGNSSPDIISSLSGIHQSKQDLVFGGIFGAGIFVTTIVAGSVIITSDFHAMERPLLRDMIFYLAAAFVVWFIIQNGKIYFKQAVILICIYVGYISFVLISSYVNKKHKTYKKKKKLKSIKSQIQINIIPPENEPKGLVNSNIKKKIRSNSSPANLNESLINQSITFQKINKFFRSTNSSGDLCSTDQLEENVILKRFYHKGILQSPRHSRVYSHAKNFLDNYFERDVIIARASQDYSVNSMSTTKTFIPEFHSTVCKSASLGPSIESSSGAKERKEGSSLLLTPSLLTSSTSLNFTNNTAASSNSAKSSTSIIDDDTLSTISINISENEPDQFSNEEIQEHITVISEEKHYFSKQFSISSIISPELIAKAISESKEFLLNICPIDISRWNEYKFYKKLIELLKSPAYFLMTLTIPVVDLESPKNNWCRSLNSLHIVTSPQIILFYLSLYDSEIGSFPLWLVILIISLPLSLITFTMSNPKSPPFCHFIFSFGGFILSVLTINTIANEIIDILQAIGVIYNLSDAILGLTILAWGNSLGDLVADVSMAKNGYPRIGIAACFGGPLLNLLLGLGLPYSVLLVDEPEKGFEIFYHRIITLLYTTISISLISSLVMFVCNRFHSKHYHGIYLICLYFVYLVFAILIEMNIL